MENKYNIEELLEDKKKLEQDLFKLIHAFESKYPQFVIESLNTTSQEKLCGNGRSKKTLYVKSEIKF